MLLSASAHALFLRRSMPITLLNRLLRNAQREAAGQPDAVWHATIARLHTLAVAGDSPELEPAEVERHITEAVAGYRRALALEERAIFFHGLGYAYEEALRRNVTAAGPAPRLREQAVAAYLSAQARAGSEPERLHHRPGFLDTVDSQTQLALMRISSFFGKKEDKGKAPKGGNGKNKGTADEGNEKGKKGKKGKDKSKPGHDEIETPVIFGAADSVEGLLDVERTVSFDIAGDGIPRRWPWVRPTTGILVWDPANSGQITSGRQLFGSVTWWIFWNDGYRALSALDDNGDGWLSGPELDGIGVWYDRNSNGISEPGEVHPCGQAGVLRIAARAQRGPDGVLTHPGGVILGNKILPSFDWLVAPVRE